MTVDKIRIRRGINAVLLVQGSGVHKAVLERGSEPLRHRDAERFLRSDEDLVWEKVCEGSPKDDLPLTTRDLVVTREVESILGKVW
jgi:hypothetical protein